MLSSFAKPLAAAGLAAAALTGLSACETYDGPNRYGPYEAGIPAPVERGTVIGARPITLGGGDTGAGAIVGGVSGGVIGSELAGRGSHFAGGIAGAVLGSLAGQAIERSNTHPGYAYLIRFDRDGSEAEIPQPDPYPLRQNTRVLVTYGARVHVRPIGDGYASAPPPPPPPPRY